MILTWFLVWEFVILSLLLRELKKGETFASLLNIHGGDIRVVPTHLVFYCFVDHGLRQRNVKTDKDIDIVIQHQHQVHEKLADEMLQLTRNLKESIRDSGQIVKQDNKVCKTLVFIITTCNKSAVPVL